MDVFLEKKLDTESRNKMKDSTFGLPEERKYPLNDASHVKSAIAFFKYCPTDKKSSLAKRIVSAAKKFGVSKSTVHKDVSVRLKKLNPSLYRKVKKILEINKKERHIRGGIATRKKYKGI